MPQTSSVKKRHGRGRFVTRALADLIGVFAPITGAPKSAYKGKGRRILIYNWRDQRHEYAGGAEVYIHELAKRLAADGNLVTFFCGSDGRGAPRHETIDGVNIVRRGGFHLVFLWAPLYYILRFRGRYDVIIDCHNGIPFFMPLFARVPVICIIHHVHQEVFKNHMGKYGAALACFLEKQVMPRVYNQSQYVAVSPSTQEQMRSVLGIREDIKLIYNGVDLATLKPAKKSPVPLVLFLGRLQKYKSVDVAIKAFKQVHKTVPTAKLVIAGGGDANDELRQLVKDQRMSSYVTFTGKVSEAKKLQLFQTAWLMVNPSFMEGWGLTTIEANACKTPVVGSDVPGLRDSISHGKTGLLVAYGDVTGFAHQMTHLLTNNKDRRQLANQAHNWAQSFHWDVSAARLRTLINHELEPTSEQPVFTELNA